MGISRYGFYLPPGSEPRWDSVAWSGSTAPGTSITTVVSKTIATHYPNTVVDAYSSWDIEISATGTSFVNGYLRWDSGTDVWVVAEHDANVHRSPSNSGRILRTVFAATGNHTIDMRVNKNNSTGTALIGNNTRVDLLIYG